MLNKKLLCKSNATYDKSNAYMKQLYPNSFTYISFYMNILHTNKWNKKKMQSLGALNTKVTPGYKKRECKKIMLINK